MRYRPEIDGLRAIAHGITLELAWPEHPVYPSHGYVVYFAPALGGSVAVAVMSRVTA